MNSNVRANIAYIEYFKTLNPKLREINCDGNYLQYNNKKVDISQIYMQDILANNALYQAIRDIEAIDLVNLIELHVYAVQVKERKNMLGAKNYELSSQY